MKCGVDRGKMVKFGGNVGRSKHLINSAKIFFRVVH